MITARHASHRWLNLRTVLLNKSVDEVEGIVSQRSSRCADSDRFYAVVEEWIKTNGPQATLGRFLEACGHPNVAVKWKVEEALLKQRPRIRH